MRSAWYPRSVVVLMLGAMVVSCTGQTPSKPKSFPKNVVIILIDTLRQDHVSAYGYHRQTSPVIDALAKSGVRADGVSPTSWTKPGTATLLTGLHPISHQALDRDDILPDSVNTLAEILDDHGYFNIGVSGNAYVSNKFSMDQGFDEFLLVQRVPGPGPSEAEELNKRVVTLLDKVNGPYFLYVHYVDPHAPYDPPYGWNGAVLPENASRRAPMDSSQLLMQLKIKRPPDLMQATIDLYDGEIRYVDTQIGLLLDELRKRSLLDSTLVVVTSDHGEEFGDHGRIGHGKTLFREVTRVPLVFSSPGFVKEGAAIGPVQLESIAPTVLEMLGLENSMDVQFDGPSVEAALRTGELADRPRILLHLDYESRAALGLVKDKHKLLVSNNPFEKALFDLRSDPTEKKNLLRGDDHRPVATQLGDELSVFHNELMERAIKRATTVVDVETVEALQALGYLTDIDSDTVPTDAPEQMRNLPADVVAPDPFWGGFLGFEDIESFTECISLAGGDTSHQLLSGWMINPRRESQWSAPRATAGFFIETSNTGGALILRGHNSGNRRFEIQVEVNGRFAGSARIDAPGDFDESIPLTGEISGRTLVQLVVDPPIVKAPTENALGAMETAKLGVDLSEICLIAGNG